ncbi:MAG: hypothetical protein WBA68_08985 [Alteraurantiacibacter sp.]
MIDIFAILLSHGLILAALCKLLLRNDLDTDAPEAAKPERPWLTNRDDGERAPDA